MGLATTTGIHFANYVMRSIYSFKGVLKEASTGLLKGIIAFTYGSRGVKLNDQLLRRFQTCCCITVFQTFRVCSFYVLYARCITSRRPSTSQEIHRDRNKQMKTPNTYLPRVPLQFLGDLTYAELGLRSYGLRELYKKGPNFSRNKGTPI